MFQRKIKVRKKILLASIGIFAFISFSLQAKGPDLEQKINTLNNASIQSLGISLNALAYLVDASPYSYMPLWHLEKSGEIQYIRELETAGYVKVTIVQGLPDGTSQSEKQVNIRPLHLGVEAQRCLLALKHNKVN